MKIYFVIYNKVEELDLVGPWELVGLLAEKGLCEPPKLISLNTMTPVGEHGMRFSADYHFSECDIPMLWLFQVAVALELLCLMLR